MALLCPSITCFMLGVQEQLNLTVFLLKIFLNLWPFGKHLSTRLMNTVPMLVWTFLLNGGLSKIYYSASSLGWVVFAVLAGILDCTRIHFYAVLLDKGVQLR